MLTEDNESLVIFERKIFRSIFGDVQVNGIWRRRTNIEIHRLYKDPGTINFIRIQRLRWAGLQIRFFNCRSPKMFPLINQKTLRKKDSQKFDEWIILRMTQNY